MSDRNYHSPNLAERLSDRELYLMTTYKSSKKEKQPWPRSLVQKGRRIETVIAELVERYKPKKVWASDRWHLRSRWLRKILSHTIGSYIAAKQARRLLGAAALLGYPAPTHTRASG